MVVMSPSPITNPKPRGWKMILSHIPRPNPDPDPEPREDNKK